MSEVYVEAWSPEYGNPLDTDEQLSDAAKVDDRIEVPGLWSPLPGADDGVEVVAFVDGVRRVEARLTLDDVDGPVPGLCGSFAVGAVRWDRAVPRSEVTDVRVQRLAVFGHGRTAVVPSPGPPLAYRSESVPDTDPQVLIQRFHGAMRKFEATLAEDLAQRGCFVVADGPINDLSATHKVGYIKTHRVPYLPPSRLGVIARLAAGERTPMFLIGQGGAYPRYSWYFRLAEMPDGHTWSGVVRAEVSSHLDLKTAQQLADRATAVLPIVASQAHIDPRAPQNLVPIAALERHLRREMGDARYVHRALRSAAMRQRPDLGAAS